MKWKILVPTYSFSLFDAIWISKGRCWLLLDFCTGNSGICIVDEAIHYAISDLFNYLFFFRQKIYELIKVGGDSRMCFYSEMQGSVIIYYVWHLRYWHLDSLLLREDLQLLLNFILTDHFFRSSELISGTLYFHERSSQINNSVYVRLYFYTLRL